MPTKTQRKRTHWRETVRVLAILFLLLACADLAFPQLCAEDNEALFPSQAAATASFAHADATGEPQPHAPQTEDCFCCCSHVISTGTGSPLEALALVSGCDPTGSSGVPPTPARILFHPPRLA